MAETVGAVSGTRKNLSVSPPQPQAAARRRSSRGLSAEAQADSPTQAGIFWQKICGWQARDISGLRNRNTRGFPRNIQFVGSARLLTGAASGGADRIGYRLDSICTARTITSVITLPLAVFLPGVVGRSKVLPED
jgi:hypothetical protein